VEGEELDDRPKPDHVALAEVRGAIVPGRWVDAGDLRVGDVVLLMDGRRLPVEEILVRQVEEKVYNFQVRGLHNYAVGVDQVLVHNNCSAAQLATNRQTGKAGELLVENELERIGFSVLGSQVSVRTTHGRRVIDHLIETPAGDILAIEVKTGNAVRSAAQLVKDAALASAGGLLVGKKAPANLRGQHLIIQTIEIFL
jgi:hypothetical protein